MNDPCRRLWFTLTLVSLLAGATGNVHAQMSGKLFERPTPDSKRAQPSELTQVFGTELTEKAQVNFAVMMASPMLTSALRASAWTTTLTAEAGASEVKFQVNICDMGLLQCADGKAAYQLTLAGPLSKAGRFSELANLDGLVGKTRVEIGGTSNLTDATDAMSFGWKAQFSTPEMKYRMTINGAEQATRDPQFSLEGSIGFKSPSMSKVLGVRYENSLKASDPTSVCVAVSGTAGAFTCADQVIGKPQRTIKQVSFAEYRIAFGQAAAAALIINWDMSRHVTGYELPIWCVRTGKDELGGGVKFGYRSDTKQVTAALFVGAMKL